ncbi:MAG: response regulator [Halomonadaceae bacterium]|nr:MAG: response regulator [Halomonadaceae bacterium]
MPNLDLPILIVDDAKFSSAVIQRTLKNAGYRNIRTTSSAPAGLKLLEQQPVSLLIADWLMPDMDGLELTDRVRQLDEQRDHYTYIILLTARDGTDALVEAFDRGVDDFVYKADMSKQLLPRVFAADRLVDRHNSLLATNQLLRLNVQRLSDRDLIDSDTSLPNHRYALTRLHQALESTEARGGATGYLVLAIRNWQGLSTRYSERAMQELAAGIGRRLADLIRPMDALCRTAPDQFTLVSWFTDPGQCTTGTFRRLHEGVNHKAFKTAAGFISVEAAMALCVVDHSDSSHTDPQSVQGAAAQALLSARDTHTFTSTRPLHNGKERAGNSL